MILVMNDRPMLRNRHPATSQLHIWIQTFKASLQMNVMMWNNISNYTLHLNFS